MRGGALDGLSIGFRTDHAPGTTRTPACGAILEADLWEISVVTFPMLPGARIEPSRAMAEPATADHPRIRTLAHAGCWADARRRSNRGDRKGFANLVRERDAAPTENELAARRIRAATRMINQNKEKRMTAHLQRRA